MAPGTSRTQTNTQRKRRNDEASKTRERATALSSSLCRQVEAQKYNIPRNRRRDGRSMGVVMKKIYMRLTEEQVKKLLANKFAGLWLNVLFSPQVFTKEAEEYTFIPVEIPEPPVIGTITPQQFAEILKDVELTKVVAFEKALLSYAKSQNAELLASVNAKPDYNDDIAAKFKALIQQFKATQTW
jgi:hypothetical protein